MKSVTRCSGLVSLIGLAMLMSGCGNDDINLTLAQSGKVVLSPKPGDHLIWSNNLQVEFLGGSPCTETAPSNECHVKSNLDMSTMTQYYYVCQHSACSDPEVDVGSGTGLDGQGRAASVTDTVALPCNSNQIQPTPAALPDSFQDGQINPGSVVQWVSVGGAPVTDWVVTFTGGDTTVCNESSIQYGAKTNTCTIKAGLAAGTYNYAVTSNTCTGKGSGAITTTQ